MKKKLLEMKRSRWEKWKEDRDGIDALSWSRTEKERMCLLFFINMD